MLILSSVPNFIHSACQKQRVNIRFLFEMIFVCIPRCFTTLSKYNRLIFVPLRCPTLAQMCHLANSINDHHNGVKSLRLWEIAHKIHRNTFPPLIGMDSGLNNMASLRNRILFCWQVTYDFTYCSSLFCKFGQ